MKVTFPHFGSSWVPLKALFDKHGIEVVVPPKSSKRTLSLGVAHSPEVVCLPYKVLLGNIIEALELGADTVITVGGPGLCRLGYYSKLQEEVLRSLGYDVQMYVFDWQGQQIVGLARFVREVLNTDRPWLEVIGDVKFGLQQLALMEDIEKKVHHLRPRELNPGEASRIWHGAGDRVTVAHTPADLRQVREEIFAELEAVPTNPTADPLRIAFLGEFYLAIEPFCNMDLEEELGKRGVEVTRMAYLMEWAKVWLFLEMIGMGHDRKVRRAANPYLKRDVSGDAIQSLGETILHQQQGFDGIIHIMPFTCLPEIIAQNIFPTVTKDFQIPVLTLVLDEQMGRGGMLTRLEAFVDLMERRRMRQAG